MAYKPKCQQCHINDLCVFTLASLKMHGTSIHKKLYHIIKPDFWLDHVHQDYDTLDWGQTPRGLPWYVRQEFLEIFPNHKDSELITWGQFKELRKHVIHELEKKDIKIHRGVPNITKTDKKYVLSLPGNRKSLLLDLDTYFYNNFREPDLNHCFFNILPNIPAHTKLYTLPKKNIPKTVIVIGSGRSVIWVAQHFPKTIIAAIKSGDSGFPLLENEKMPKNLIEYDVNLFEPDGSIFKISQVKNVSNCQAIITNLQVDNQDFLGYIYCAIGLKPNFEVTRCVISQNLLTYPHEGLFQWHSSEETPVGSLMEATQRWAIATDNLSWAYETHCYHENYFIEIFSRQMEKAGIILPYDFFDLLREKAIELRKTEPSLNKIPVRLTSDEQVIKLYKDCYKSVFNDNISIDTLNKFEFELRRFEQERVEQYKKSELNNTVAP